MFLRQFVVIELSKIQLDLQYDKFSHEL